MKNLRILRDQNIEAKNLVSEKIISKIWIKIWNFARIYAKAAKKERRKTELVVMTKGKAGKMGGRPKGRYKLVDRSVETINVLEDFSNILEQILMIWKISPRKIGNIRENFQNILKN